MIWSMICNRRRLANWHGLIKIYMANDAGQQQVWMRKGLAVRYDGEGSPP